MKKKLASPIQKLQQPLPMPPLDRSRIEETIARSQQILRRSKLERRTSSWQFFLIQFRFIGIRLWVMQLLIVLALGLLSYIAPPGIESNQFMVLVSTAAPMLVLTGIQILTRSAAFGMMEIEWSTRHSLERLTMVRLCILGLGSLFFLLLAAGLFSLHLERQLWLLLLCLLVPFNLTCFGCLWIINRVRNRDAGYYCWVYGAGLLIAQVVLSFQVTERSQGGWLSMWAWLQQGTATGFWIALLLASTVAIALELRIMLAGCRKADARSLSYT